ncbi:MAG: hypothetical protein IJ091_04395 [Oscillospiraceae bacterium]|nr:hypothetical protein [Oscillospiraceae bacterium]
MKYRVKVKVPVEKKTLFGKRTVYVERTIEVDRDTYRKIQKEKQSEPFSLEEMMFYDDIFDDD